MAEEQNTNETRLVGMLAQFDDPHTLVAACDNARQFGYEKMDAYSPFPVHGIDPALGISRTKLPFIVLAIGLGAVAIGLGMQYYTNAADWSPIFPGYAFKISGKPIFSLPANIPVTFEVIVLSSAFATFFGMWGLNKLPMFANPLHRISRFRRATNDKFFLMIESADGKFDEEQIRGQFNSWGATAIEECREDLTDQKLPQFVWVAALIAAFMLILPPVLIYRAVGMTNEQPRMHFMPDMDWQDKFKTQVMSPNLSNEGGKDYLFMDLRAMRAQIPGTIARGDSTSLGEYETGVQEDSIAAYLSGEVYTGLAAQDEDAPAEPDWITGFPEGVTVDEDLLTRGRERFNIYCSACHGYSGNGDGLVNQRAVALNLSGSAAWTAAKSLHDPEVKNSETNPVGRIFDTISNGRGTMGPYRDQIPVEDRWAIVAYVKALQETGIEPPAAEEAAAADGAATEE
ncbi:MAG: quinol:electron acceptor oxidoreductase subunit ActD [Planctomycetota bacterium]